MKTENKLIVAIASVQLSKIAPIAGGAGYITTNSMTLHYRIGVESKDEMRGIAVAEALDAKPGFSIEQVLVQIFEPAP